MGNDKIRVQIAKVGLDTHDLGAKLVANVLKDAGMEVVYLRPHTTTDEVVSAAIQEDVDVIGMSISSGAHLSLCSKVIDLLRKKGVKNKAIIVGGVIPKKDITALKKMGVTEVAPTGTHPDKIVEIVRKSAKKN